jgi:Holliday junction resolvase RusA-like endonuclease
MKVRIDLNCKIMPKPRGKLGKQGNIYHNDKRYVTYKKLIESQLISQIGKGFNWSYPIKVALICEFKPQSKEPDLMDNQIGSLLDCLVQWEYLKDDSRKYIRGGMIDGLESYQDKSILWISDYSSWSDVEQEYLKELQAARTNLLVKAYKTKYSSY